jgi:membrane-associated phospholipid phosphatase
VTAAGYLLAAYALATLPLAIRGGSWAAFAMHLGAATVLVAIRGRRARTWLPIVVAPLLYFTLPDLMRGWAGGEVLYHDAWLMRWELAVFGNPSRQLAGFAPWCLLSELLHAGYLSYYPMIFVPAALLSRAGDEPGTRTLALAVGIAFVVCYAAFILFPVQGPRYISAPEVICDGPLRRATLGILESGSSRGAAFPSSHVAVAVAASVACWYRRASWTPVVAAATVLLATGAVYGGFHYAIDVVAGGVVGMGAAYLTRLLPQTGYEAP